jgi:uncharacterized protein YciI
MSAAADAGRAWRGNPRGTRAPEGRLKAAKQWGREDMSDEENPKSVPAAGVMEASKADAAKAALRDLHHAHRRLGPVFANIEEHLKFQVELEREGVMFAAGPMWTDDEQSWEGEGLVMVRAGSREEAIAIAERDPMHKAAPAAFRSGPGSSTKGR